MGIAADLCFPIIPAPSEAAAVRAYALTICHRICEAEPALADELKLSIEACIDQSPAAVKSRGRRILKALGKRPKG